MQIGPRVSSTYRCVGAGLSTMTRSGVAGTALRGVGSRVGDGALDETCCETWFRWPSGKRGKRSEKKLTFCS